ncbi:MAG: hypothetical protein ACXVCX_21440 [Ktedonobacterales bacterium]
MQNSHMRAFRLALSVACFVAGLVLVLRLLGLLEAIPHGISHWWPALPGLAGVAILARSFRPGRHYVVAGGLLLASGIAFASIHGFMTERTWVFAGAGGLMIAGIVLAWRSITVRSAPAGSRSAVKRVLFRAETFTPSSAELERLKVFVMCGNIKLDLRGIIVPGAPRDVFWIDITACAGKAKIVLLKDTVYVNHEAFVLRLGKPLEKGFLDEEESNEADVVMATLGFFGGVDIEKKATDLFPCRARPVLHRGRFFAHQPRSNRFDELFFCFRVARRVVTQSPDEVSTVKVEHVIEESSVPLTVSHRAAVG